MALRDKHRFFDIRTVRRHIRSGRVTKEQHREFLSTLRDVAENIMDPSEGGDSTDGFEPEPGG
ncbi:MAG: hypothetical protein H6713_19130 [Myxococcales bacterium]|nr:hypothetical protein [Myxococcales bacterium]